MRSFFMFTSMVAILSHPSLQEKQSIGDWKADDLANTNFESEDRGWWGNRCCRKLKEKLGEAKEDISINTQIISSTCNAVGAILANNGPQYNSTATSFPPTPSPNPVSAAINGVTGAGYPIFYPITAGGAAVAGGTIADGLDTAAGTSSDLGTSTDTA